MKYKLTKTCKSCGNIDSFSLTKIEAAFELYDSRKAPCSKCKSTYSKFLKYQYPKLDQDILDIWASNSDYFLMEQDEELFLAEIDYLPIILHAIDHSKYPSTKLNILIEAICILLYDNIVSPHKFSIEENNSRKIIADLVRPELIKRKERIIQAGDTVMDYIQKIVYPEIGIKI